MKWTLAGAVLAFAACNVAWAQEAESDKEAHEGRPHTHWWLELDPGFDFAFYAGAGLGQSRYQTYEIADDGSFTSSRTDDTDTGLRLFGGMGIGKYFALEASYADFGEASFRAQSDGSAGFWNAGPQRTKFAAEGYDVSLVGRVPLTDDWALFAKGGTAWLRVDFAVAVDAQCCGVVQASDEVDNDAEGITYGGGVQYDGWRPVRIVAEYGVLPFDVDFFADDGELDWIAISAAYLFD